MKIVCIFALLSLLSMCNGFSIVVGSYIRESFNSNDARINSAYQIVRNEILSKNESGSTDVVPVAIYSQLVNGINYKIITAIKDKKNFKVELSQAIIYTGEFGSDSKPSLTFFEKLPTNNLTLDETRMITLSATITNYLSSLGASLSKVNSVTSYPNLVSDESYFIVHGDASSGLNQYFIVSQNSDKTYTVLKTINFNSGN